MSDNEELKPVEQEVMEAEQVEPKMELSIQPQVINVSNHVKEFLELYDSSHNTSYSKIANTEIHQLVQIINGQPYQIIAIKRKLSAPPSEDDILDLCMKLTQIPPSDLGGFLLLAGYMELSPSSENLNEKSYLMFSYPMVKVGVFTPELEF